MSTRTRSHRGLLAPLALLVAGLATVLGSFNIATADPVGSIISYEQTADAALPPAANFTGSGGGDGWDLAFDDTNVYNVFHHLNNVVVSCHNKSTAVACSTNGYVDGKKTVLDGGINLSTSMGPSMYIDPATNHLFVWATKTYTTVGTAGVVEIDLDSTEANPFVAFHPLSREGEATCYTGSCTSPSSASLITNATRIGTKWYAYNFVSNVASPALPDSRNKLLCFDLSAKGACASQPFDVTTAGNVQLRTGWSPSNVLAGVGTKVIIPIYDTSGSGSIGEMACVDVSSTPTNCAGWPITPASITGAGSYAVTPFPRLDSTGTPIGVCFPNTPNVCVDFSGTTQTITTDLKNLAAPVVSGWESTRNEALVYGTRIYVMTVVAGDASEVGCYDYATDALCEGFPNPKAWTSSEVAGVYTVTQDPTYPSCLWVNADHGSAQIQNFDYRTGGVCGEGGSLLPVTDFVESNLACQVTQWTKFQLESPATGEYTSGTVEFDDSDGDPIPGIAVQDIGADGSIDLSSLGLESAVDFANLRVRLEGATVPTIDVTLTWKAEWHPECIAQGQTALTTTTTTEATTSTTAAPTSEAPTTIVEEQLPYTGSSSTALIVGGVGMLAVGAGAVLLAQRRQKLV